MPPNPCSPPPPDIHFPKYKPLNDQCDIVMCWDPPPPLPKGVTRGQTCGKSTGEGAGYSLAHIWACFDHLSFHPSMKYTFGIHGQCASVL